MGGKESKDKVGDYVIEREQVLGDGSFGRVYKGYHSVKKNAVAMKECRVSSPKTRAAVQAEIVSFKKVPEHRHIVRLLNYYTISDVYWFIMEYCDHGNLETYMVKHSPDLVRQIKLMHQCATGVAHMHDLSPPLIHRDLKPSNILIKKEAGSDVVKIADFGMARFADTLVRSVSGTSLFMAPEIIGRRGSDEAVDTFALGLVFLSMLQFNPADGELRPLSETCLGRGTVVPLGEEMENASKSGKPMPTVISMSNLDLPKKKAVKQLILDMTSYEPRQRALMIFVVRKLEDQLEDTQSENKSSKFKDVVQLNLLSNLTMAQTEDSGDFDDIETDSAYANFQHFVFDFIEKQRNDLLTTPKSGLACELRNAGLLPVYTLFKFMDHKPAEKFEIGERVTLEKNVSRAQKIQEILGQWNEEIRMYLGKHGLVTKKHNDEEVDVEFADRKRFTLSAYLLDRAEATFDQNGEETSGGLRVFDIVAVGAHGEELRQLQQDYGGYDSRMDNFTDMRGVVYKIGRDGGVTVEFVGHVTLHFNPKALVKEDTSGMDIDPGDAVLVDHKLDRIKEKQKGHGEWVDNMTKCLGRTGIVKAVDYQKNRAKVEMNNCGYLWNTALLTVVNKSEEMIEVLDNRTLVQKNATARVPGKK